MRIRLQITGGTAYLLLCFTLSFFDAIDRVSEDNYVPTDADIVHARVRSTGIVEERFRVQGKILRILDVGGQRSERKKW